MGFKFYASLSVRLSVRPSGLEQKADSVISLRSLVEAFISRSMLLSAVLYRVEDMNPAVMIMSPDMYTVVQP